MKKPNKIIYMLSAVIGISVLTAGTVVAGYGYGNNKAKVQTSVKSDKDGSIFPGGACKNCNKDGSLFKGDPCVSCSKDGSLFPGTCQRCAKREPERKKIKNYVAYNPAVYEATARNCCDMAPLALAHVDFRIKKDDINAPYTNKLGNYRFRIFGCRRYDKEAELNKGRIWEKNIAFNKVFEDVVGDCYKVLPMPKDLCIEEAPSELPDYALTAEITDYFMNICDEYNWDEAEKNNARHGTSEITVTWRLMDVTMNTVYWKGETTGYGELQAGENDGEIKLIERAFADATGNLRNMPGFEDQLALWQEPGVKAAQRAAIIEKERTLNPLKCGFRKEYECVKRCEISRPGANPALCQPCLPCVCPQVTCVNGVANQTPLRVTADGLPIVPSVETLYETSGCNCNGVTNCAGGIYECGNVVANGVSGCTQTVITEGAAKANGTTVGKEVIVEEGNVVGNGVVTCDGGVINGGTVLSDGSVVSECATITKDGVVTDGGVKGSTVFSEGGANGNGTVQSGEVLAEGVVSEGGVSEQGVITEGGASAQGIDIISSCIDENGNVKADGMCKIVDDTWIDTGDVKALDNFCVVSTDPCKSLSPETIYRMRSSIVQIESPNGKKGAGLLISDRFVLTSGDLVDKNNNKYKIKTVRNGEMSARAVRINLSKNTALFMLDKSTTYTPLALNLSLPEVGRSGFLTVGLLDVTDFKNGEDYLENSAKIEGYRYTEERGAEILANTFIQNVTVGGALIYKDCTINGMAHSGVKTSDGLDMFIPTETALRSLGISICGHEYVEESPWQQTVYKPVSEQIKQVQKAPEVMKAEERK